MKLMVWLGALVLAAQAGAQGWEKELPEALAAAGKNRVVMAHFWRADCPWCEELEKSTYSTAGFAELAQQMVSVRIHGEGAGVPLVEKYGVRGYPTLLFLDGQGEVLGRIQGYVSIDALRAAWENAQRRLTGPVSHTDRVAIAAAKRDEAGVVRAMKVLENERDIARDVRAEANLAAGVFFEEEMRQQEARPLFDKALVEAESPRLQAYARLGIVRTLLSVGRFGECVKHLEAALATKKLFESDVALAQRLLKLAREKAGMPPPDK